MSRVRINRHIDGSVAEHFEKNSLDVSGPERRVRILTRHDDKAFKPGYKAKTTGNASNGRSSSMQQKQSATATKDQPRTAIVDVLPQCKNTPSLIKTSQALNDKTKAVRGPKKVDDGLLLKQDSCKVRNTNTRLDKVIPSDEPLAKQITNVSARHVCDFPFTCDSNNSSLSQYPDFNNDSVSSLHSEVKIIPETSSLDHTPSQKPVKDTAEPLAHANSNSLADGKNEPAPQLVKSGQSVRPYAKVFPRCNKPTSSTPSLECTPSLDRTPSVSTPATAENKSRNRPQVSFDTTPHKKKPTKKDDSQSPVHEPPQDTAEKLPFEYITIPVTAKTLHQPRVPKESDTIQPVEDCVNSHKTEPVSIPVAPVEILEKKTQTSPSGPPPHIKGGVDLPEKRVKVVDDVTDAPKHTPVDPELNKPEPIKKFHTSSTSGRQRWHQVKSNVRELSAQHRPGETPGANKTNEPFSIKKSQSSRNIGNLEVTQKNIRIYNK